ncbi:TrmH family RNA methyltransferase [Allorhodopirellula heiligendammensis]|uniref:TrmH family tRNA/rRNA methyltransferase n=1 Tax=Allorhodopirellula heiligendammensis TaxID=2714739 RepID=A0A5C6BHN3_9BACT|nr:RNA methyltransferase [Allorhodopirellula heiligendammensis]TWU10836.1 putative TrmH family tRNA/rRNA methyltransferase [Allorhodopirellula heiligendammensis]
MFIEVTDPQDPRLNAFRDVRIRDPRNGFIAEGSLVVRRLLQSELSLRSLLLHRGQESKYAALIPDSTPAFVVDPQIGEQIAGYDFHRGVLAHGECPTMLGCEELARRRPPTALALIGISDPENVGSLLRSAAALGVHDILIGPQTITPFARRVIRVSMASVFHHRFYQFDEPVKQITQLQTEGIQFAATTPAKDAIAIDTLGSELARHGTVLVVGNEASGLDRAVQDACSLRTTLPMHESTDSLNVGVAGAIFLYELSKQLR